MHQLASVQKTKKDYKKKAHERYQNLSEEDKNKEQYHRERYKNLP